MRGARFILASALFALMAGAALAQPAPRAVGPTIADAGSAFYRFEQVSVTSADGARVYRVQIGVPRKAAGAAGYPVAYLLDGDAAMARIDEALLGQLNAGDPPVIVTVGYQGDRQFDVLARAYDYTPPAPDGAYVVDAAGRPGGGADAFLTLLHDQIAPLVAAHVRIDAERSLLWGHSYGGLCVLHAALTRPDAYGRFVSVSPSLWWNYGSVLAEVDPFLTQPHPSNLSLTLLVGEEEVAGRGGRTRTNPMWSSVPSGATRDLAMRLHAAGVDVRFAELPGQAHGGMLAASLIPTLLSFAGVAPAPGDALS
ncbi:alpha/beta hydrolase-fold protein [Brevundimonas sp.]|uniref:alpha/beta hydrolase n=1 Tax=Brevundimonas sp. TaxID=1871086 RepID=UPI0025B96647|nr:alpha/beta hydrolase-fold protein [Brevundimonas sp.]